MARFRSKQKLSADEHLSSLPENSSQRGSFGHSGATMDTSFIYAQDEALQYLAKILVDAYMRQRAYGKGTTEV